MIFINSAVRLKAKSLLSGNTARLFLISALSFILRWGYALVNFTGLFHFLRSDIFKHLLESYNNALIYTLSGIIYFISFYLMISTVSVLRMGERFAYYTRAEGGKGRFGLLFKFMGIKGGFRALRTYLTINGLKLLWLVYFLLPTLLCGACIIYLYVFGRLSATVLIALFTGEALLLSISLVMWRVSTLRYEATVYYMCLRDISVRKAIKKSILHTDGVLSDGVVLEYSLLGWILSCIFVIPLFYSIPYIKMCKATFVTEAVSRRVSVKSTYAVNYFPLSRKHINESN